MEEFGGEAQSLAMPQRVAGIEPDRAVVLVLQVLQRVGQRRIGRLVRFLRQVAREVAHGRAIERRRLLGPRGTAQRGNDRQHRGLQQDVTPTHRVSLGSKMWGVTSRDWGEMMPVQAELTGYSRFSTRKPPTMPAASMLVTRVSRRSMKSRTGVPNARSKAGDQEESAAAGDDAGGHEHREVELRPRRRRW